VRIEFTSQAAKLFLARKGPPKVFGDEVDQREELTDQDAIRWFDQRWDGLFLPALSKADRIDIESVREKVPIKSRGFIRDSAEHREFRLHGCHFICQLPTPSTSDQLWFIPSSSADPRIIFVKFETLPIRKEFDAIAAELKWEPEKLAEKLLLDFMETVTQKSYRGTDE